MKETGQMRAKLARALASNTFANHMLSDSSPGLSPAPEIFDSNREKTYQFVRNGLSTCWITHNYVKQ